jgi:hypothetical protein
MQLLVCSLFLLILFLIICDLFDCDTPTILGNGLFFHDEAYLANACAWWMEGSANSS